MMRNHTLDTPINISAIAGIRKADTPITDRHFVVENSFDLAPVDQIIWASIQEEINNLGSGEKLAIVMGEFHEQPSHIMPQISLARSFSQWQNNDPRNKDRQFIHALEQPYNYLADMADYLYDLPVSQSDTQILLHHTNSQSLLSKAMLISLNHQETSGDMPFAPMSVRRRYEAYIKNRVPIIFNDAACQCDSPFIDPNDGIAYQVAMDDFGIDLHSTNIPMAPELVDNGDKIGVEIRNGCMVERATACKERIIFQQCGVSHLYGETGENPPRDGAHPHKIPYETSLIYQYEQAGYKTLGIYFSLISATEDRVINPTDVENHRNHIIIEGISNIGFNHFTSRYTQRSNELDPALMIKEKHHIESLTSAYRGASCPFGKHDIELPTYIELRNELKRIMGMTPQT